MFNYLSTYFVSCQVPWYTFFMPRPSKFVPKPIDPPISPLGPRLAKIRRLKGFTQYTLADIMGVSRKQIADYEQGLALPNSDMIIRLATTLKISADTLLGLKDTVPNENVQNVRFSRRLKDIEQLPESKKRAVVKILDEFLRPV
jgi:transcriptional regulator with XRE-family HTH domain